METLLGGTWRGRERGVKKWKKTTGQGKFTPAAIGTNKGKADRSMDGSHISREIQGN